MQALQRSTPLQTERRRRPRAEQSFPSSASQPEDLTWPLLKRGLPRHCRWECTIRSDVESRGDGGTVAGCELPEGSDGRAQCPTDRSGYETHVSAGVTRGPPGISGRRLSAPLLPSLLLRVIEPSPESY